MMHKIEIMCNILQAEELDVSYDTDDMRIAYSSLSGIRNDTEDLKNKDDAALALTKSMVIDGLADFNKVPRRKAKKTGWKSW